jgi:hypothetical protein
MILTGLGGIVIVEIYAAVMQHVFQNTKNQVGKGFAILGIYLFVVIYCKHLLFFSPPLATAWTTNNEGGNRWHVKQHNMALRFVLPSLPCQRKGKANRNNRSRSLAHSTQE